MFYRSKKLRFTSKPNRSKRHAFSLVELMVVIVIVGLLAGVVTISVRSYLIRGKQSVAKLEIAKISEALDTFYTEYDRYPTNEEGIEILAEKSQEFTDGLLNRVPKDPWGNAYEYHIPGTTKAYEIICYGADHQEGGDDANADLSSEVTEEAKP